MQTKHNRNCWHTCIFQSLFCPKCFYDIFLFTGSRPKTIPSPKENLVGSLGRLDNWSPKRGAARPKKYQKTLLLRFCSLSCFVNTKSLFGLINISGNFQRSEPVFKTPMSFSPRLQGNNAVPSPSRIELWRHELGLVGK